MNEKGCADAGLYDRFLDAGLRDVKMFPQWASFGDGPSRRNYESQAGAILDEAEIEEWRIAARKADAVGTFFIAQPFHCAVGRMSS